MRPLRVFLLIIVLFLLSAFVAFPREFSIPFKKETHIKLPGINVHIGNFSVVRDLKTKFGLDIAGGSHLVFEADMKDTKSEDRQSALDSVAATVDRRVNLFGISEPAVLGSKVGESYRVNVDLPGITDATEATQIIGRTAQLMFLEEQEIEIAEAATKSAGFVPTGLSGKDLVRAKVEFSPETGQPVVGFQLTNEAAKTFGDITTRNVNKPLGIALDEELITAPIVQTPITGGTGIIEGNFTTEQARELAVLLNSGALPVPLKLVEQRTIGPTLGKESVNLSIRAGLVGVAAVALFMTLYYGRLGIIATVALVMYGVFALAIFKLVPIVLTLPGIAGFLLSVGMAVDSNILTFERFKEEMRRGLDYRGALEIGFGRAWDSIRDANIATLLTAFILFNPLNWSFLHTSGPVRGFAATLVLGVLLSLFTGIVVTRTLLRIFAKGGKA